MKLGFNICVFDYHLTLEVNIDKVNRSMRAASSSLHNFVLFHIWYLILDSDRLSGAMNVLILQRCIIFFLCLLTV